MKKTRILVLFGGRSSEHEISIRSASSIISGVDHNRYEPIPVAIERNGQWLSPQHSATLLPDEVAGLCSTGSIKISMQPDRCKGFDVVFPVLHGPYGEDGRVQGLLDLADIPYVGSGVLGSACGMDKDVLKRLCKEQDIPTLPHISVHKDNLRDSIEDIERKIGYPLFIKPANLGSSVGISRIDENKKLLPALEYAATFDLKVLIEPAVDAREIECALLGNENPEASLPGEIVTQTGFYDYEAKYIKDDTRLIIPADLEPEQVHSIKEMSVKAFQSLGCYGLARADFFIEKNSGQILLNELNTMPGFTSISMYPKMWEASGLPYTDLINRLIELAFERHQGYRQLSFDRK